MHHARSLQAEEQQLIDAQPPAPRRLRQVREWLGERRSALKRQQHLLEDKQLVGVSV